MPRIDSEGETVRFTFDGSEVEAKAGEPLASALVAAGYVAFARSPKFHRPRGPACFRAACDGCLARVDGSPNVMTCLRAARGGEVVESQNTLGPRDLDLLRLTDWFFPEGFNHHELFAGVVGVQRVMQIFARRIAGLGKLPERAAPSRAAAREKLDALVIGGGPSGLAIAARLVEAGRSVTLVDDGLALGGLLPGRALSPVHERFGKVRSRVRLMEQSTAVGTFGDDVLVVSPAETFVFEARDVVLATGAHDGVLAFAGNDLPGVMSARAACAMLRWGALPGKRVVVVITEGAGPYGEAYAHAIEGSSSASVTVVRGTPLTAKGSSRVRAIELAGGASHDADAVLIDAPSSPSYELAEQLGAVVRQEPRGYVVSTERGRVRSTTKSSRVWAVGELVGTPLSAAAILANADEVAAAIAG